MKTSSAAKFKKNSQTHLKHLKLKGLRPKTMEAYARAIRRIGEYFDDLDDLSEQQLLNYFTDLLATHAWAIAPCVKLDLYGLKFYYTHVLHKPWVAIDRVKAPKTQRLADIITVAEAQKLFASTRILSGVLFHRLQSGTATG